MALLAVLLLALMVVGIWALYGAFADGDDADSDEQASTEETDPEATATPDSGGTEPEGTDDDDDAEAAEDETPEGYCPAGDIEVRAATNEETFGADVAPLLIMEIENTGSETCTLDVGTAEQTFRVATGGREIFTTAQCEIDGESLELDFEPGQTERAQMVWPRSDSSLDCAERADLATGDYELTVSVSGVTSEPHTFHLTGVTE